MTTDTEQNNFDNAGKLVLLGLWAHAGACHCL
jgi:hypothetical protein